MLIRSNFLLSIVWDIIMSTSYTLQIASISIQCLMHLQTENTVTDYISKEYLKHSPSVI